MTIDDLSPYKQWKNADGQLHRIDGPAVEGEDGTRVWHLNGVRHRIDGPAYEGSDGTREWCVNGVLHRIDGPAVERADGTKEWWVNGKLHREDGPARERADGRKEWWVNGKLHRVDGPAIEYANGHKKWWINGTKYKKKYFLEHPLVQKMKDSQKLTISVKEAVKQLCDAYRESLLDDADFLVKEYKENFDTNVHYNEEIDSLVGD